MAKKNTSFDYSKYQLPVRFQNSFCNELKMSVKKLCQQLTLNFNTQYNEKTNC